MTGGGRRTLGRWGGGLVFVRLLLTALAVCFQIENASAEFRIRHRGPSGHLVIFVHGLWGKPLESFTAESEKKSWLDLMKEDNTSFGGAPALSTYSTATLGYPAGSSDRYSLFDITAKLMGELGAEPELDKHRAIYFAAHSFGGLVVEQVLVNAHLTPGSPLAERTRAAFLIATPSQGAPLADVAARLPGAIRGRLVVNLQLKDTGNFLRGLQEQWRIVREARKEAGRPIVFQCAYELRPTLGNAVIVPRASIDSSCNAFPIDADHIQIVKPTKPTDEIYQWLLRQLAALNRPRPQEAKPSETAESRPPPVEVPPGKGPQEQPPAAAPQATDRPSKQPANGGKVAMSAPQQKGTTPSGQEGLPDNKGGEVTSQARRTGIPILRLVELDLRLDTVVRLEWGRRKVPLLPRGADRGPATHDLHVRGTMNNRSVATDCSSGVQWKLAWTLEFELVPLMGTAPARRGKVTEGVCHGTGEQAALELDALRAAVRSMIGKLETWSIQ